MNLKERLKSVYLVILVGGKGERLFPISNPQRPKPVIPIVYDRDPLDWKNDTLVLRTISNFLKVGFLRKNIILVTSNEYQTELFIKEAAIPMGISPNNVWEIPPEYGYAGTMAEVTRTLHLLNHEAIVVNTPSDHYIASGNSFANAITKTIDTVENGHVAAIGIKPTEPDTIMNCGNFIYSDSLAIDGVAPIFDFVEKPDEEYAIELLNSKATLCNTGICAWNSRDFLRLVQGPYTELNTEKLMKSFNGNSRVVVGEFKWHDCGTLKSLYTALDEGRNSCVILGDGQHLIDSRSTGLFFADSDLMVNVSKMEECAVIFANTEKKPHLLVADIHESSRQIRLLAERYSANKDVFEDDFDIGARNNCVVHSKMYHRFNVSFVGVENIEVNVYEREEYYGKTLVAEVYPR